MSREAAIAFLKKAEEDAELQKRLVAFAAEHGYHFAKDELSDAELGGVAGGLVYTPKNGPMPTPPSGSDNTSGALTHGDFDSSNFVKL